MENASSVGAVFKYEQEITQLREEISKYDLHAPKNKSALTLLKWFIETTAKNTVIFKSKKSVDLTDQETYEKTRYHVYYVDFGCGIGSEIHDKHYAVVLKELKYVAVVVPLTTKKESVPYWMKDNCLVVDIGVVEGFPRDSKECYANVSGIQAVSKKRLERCRSKEDGYFDIILSGAQVELIKINIFSNILL